MHGFLTLITWDSYSYQLFKLSRLLYYSSDPVQRSSYWKFFQVYGILKVLTWLEYTVLIGNQEMVFIDVIGIPLSNAYSFL